MTKKEIKNRYVQFVGIIVVVLALVRCGLEGCGGADGSRGGEGAEVRGCEDTEAPPHTSPTSRTRYLLPGERPHRVLSVPDYQTAFPDSNELQLTAARRWGVSPVRNRADAERRMSELVGMQFSPYYHVDPLTQSIPYLVPRAAILLEDIGRAFFDSLQVKGKPLSRFIVSSVLRSEDDVARLRRFNKNATERSCHLYGTTFDIAYNRYEAVQHPDSAAVRPAPGDQLKWILSEVLRDKRAEGRCYIKYEVKQGCFHITVR